jgi:hypothetical protein
VRKRPLLKANWENRMSTYMLVFHEKPASNDEISAEEIQAIIEKYKAWCDGLRDRKVLIGGEKLVDGGRVMRREQGQVRVTDGPFAESKEVIAGYVAIKADSYEKAVELSRDCPHLEFGTIEIREVHDV